MEKKSHQEDFRILSLRQLCLISKIEYYKLYNNLKGNYTTLDTNDKTTLANALFEALIPVFKYLGFKISLERLPKKLNE